MYCILTSFSQYDQNLGPISKTTDPLLKTEKNHCSDIKLISSAGDTARSQTLRLLKGTFKLTGLYIQLPTSLVSVLILLGSGVYLRIQF